MLATSMYLNYFPSITVVIITEYVVIVGDMVSCDSMPSR